MTKLQNNLSSKTASQLLLVCTITVFMITFLVQLYFSDNDEKSLPKEVFSAEQIPPVKVKQEFKKINKAVVPILMYHHLGESPNPYYSSPDMYVSHANFKDQMKYLKKNKYNTILVKDLLNAFDGKSKLPKKPVIITFDDGFSEHYNIGFKTLHKLEMKATFYIPTYVLNIDYEYWIKDWMLKHMSDTGMEIGSHSATHPYLTQIDSQQVTYELFVSKRELEDIIDKPVFSYSHTGCFHNQFVVQKVKDAKYIGAVSCGPGTLQEKKDRYVLERRTITNDMNLFRSILND